MTGYPLQGEENQKDRDLVAMATGADHLVLCWLLAYGSLLSFPVHRPSAWLSLQVQGEHQGTPGPCQDPLVLLPLP